MMPQANIFQPVLRISYTESDDTVYIQSFNVEGVLHFGPAKKMKHENLPTLFFQLIDAGYRLAPEEKNNYSANIVYAFSREYIDRVEEEMKRVGKA